jgi:N-terminal EH-domain containing protein
MAEAQSAASDRTLKVCARLRELYQRSILPVEKRYRYDYFFDSPLLSDVEFDGTDLHMCCYRYAVCYHANALLNTSRRFFSETPSFTCGTVFRRENLLHSILAWPRLSWSTHWPRAHNGSIHGAIKWSRGTNDPWQCFVRYVLFHSLLLLLISTILAA